jgi:hypothetical protein
MKIHHRQHPATISVPVSPRNVPQHFPDLTSHAGNSYNGVGNYPAKFFDRQWSNLQNVIKDHMTFNDYVPVDVSQFTPSQVAEVQQFIAPLGPGVFLVGQ